VSVEALLARYAGNGCFGAIDLHFARFVVRMARPAGDEELATMALTAALLSRERGRGHTCIALPEIADPFAPDEARPDGMEPAGGDRAGAEFDPHPFPPLPGWRKILRSFPGLVSDGTTPRPMVLDGSDRLYLFRYFEAEREIAETAASLLEEDGRWSVRPDPALLKDLFPAETDGGVNWQAVAALSALTHRLSVVTGGPGTGKTSTVIRFLALLIRAFPGVRVGMAAPTGKAAARLGESIREGIGTLPVERREREQLPTEVKTLHRLLGYHGASHTFRHDRRRPLPLDVLVVDEASMVDLLVWKALVRALPDEARLLLLGDRNQLPSVETGYVLADLCGVARVEREHGAGFRAYCAEFLGREPRIDAKGSPGEERPPAIGDAVVELRRNYRFGPGSAIGDLARAVNDAAAEEALAVLTDASRPQAAIAAARAALDGLGDDGIEEDATGDATGGESAAVADLEGILRVYLDIVRLAKTERGDTDTEATVNRALKLLNRARILCATRRGELGLYRVTERIEGWLDANTGRTARGEAYAGRPVMVTTNDYQVNLFNGDVGICWPDEEGTMLAWFEAVRRDGSAYLRRLSMSRLPEHETAWAMTIHKSQGSQFERVAMVLPETHSALLTRELLYTAVTRASRSLLVLSDPDIFIKAVRTPSVRRSGLAEMLRERFDGAR
jgi:exodeoxyribonuclease V alpha subunit